MWTNVSLSDLKITGFRKQNQVNQFLEKQCYIILEVRDTQPDPNDLMDPLQIK